MLVFCIKKPVMLTDLKNRLVVAKREGLGKDGVGGWGWQMKFLCTEWINDKVLLYSTVNYIQYPDKP